VTSFRTLVSHGSVREKPRLTDDFAYARGQIRRLEDEICPDQRRKDAGACNSNPQISGGEAFAGRLHSVAVDAAARKPLQLAASRQKFCRQAGLTARVTVCRRGA